MPERGLDTLRSLGTEGTPWSLSSPSVPRYDIYQPLTTISVRQEMGEGRAGISVHSWIKAQSSSSKPNEVAEDSKMSQSAASPNLPFPIASDLIATSL